MTSFNVLNFFSTLNNGDDASTSLLGSEPHGANYKEEFQHQLTKLVTVLTALDLDVLGLIELENDFGDDSGALTSTGLVRPNCPKNFVQIFLFLIQMSE